MRKLLLAICLYVFALSASSQTTFYGMAPNGGNDGVGTIFKATLNAGTGAVTLENKVSLPTANSNPSGGLVYFSNGKYYGMSPGDGVSTYGTLFEWDGTGSTVTTKVAFTTDNRFPVGSLVYLNGLFYGVTNQGGTGDAGTIFSWNPNTLPTAVTTVFEFGNASNIALPIAGLTGGGNKLYGICNTAFGKLFEWNPAAPSGITEVALSAQGWIPRGKLKYIGGKLYGTGAYGGSNNRGGVFEWVPGQTPTYYSLQASGSEFPAGGLTLYNGKLYGLSSQGGTQNLGTIFQWDYANPVASARVPTLLYSFVGSTGFYPTGNLLVSGNSLLGMTQYDGPIGYGSVFAYKFATPATIAFEYFDDANGVVNGGNPPTDYPDLELIASAVFVTLPLNLLSFTGKVSSDAAQLSWITSSEVNTERFIVERSTTGSAYTSIGSIAAAGTSSTNKTYTFNDAAFTSLSAPVVYYRLRMEDIDGKFKYSPVVPLRKKAGVASIALQPNPVRGEVKVLVSVDKAQRFNYQILDAKGAEMVRGVRNIAEGTTSIGLGGENLQAGSYTLIIKGTGLNQTLKMVKQ
jgi:uncharacterized repeat protein (TIGR03803 family)